jgi:peptidoglycan/LPS O-acetylase OafA/YrhL
MWKFALAAFVPAFLAGYAVAEPGQYRASTGIGAGLAFLGAGLLAIYIARRNDSRHPFLWGTGVFIAFAGSALLGASN